MQWQRFRAWLRFGAVAVAAMAVSGCATFIPFQAADEVVVRVGDNTAIYDPRGIAKAYRDYAVLATRAYDDSPVTGAALNYSGATAFHWSQVPLPPFRCPEGKICAGELGVRLWIRTLAGRCQEAVIAYRGTIFNSVDDWIANFRWFHRNTPLFDYYDQARTQIGAVVRVAESRGCAGRIVAVGHSLGGGLAQHVAYSHPKIRVVYAFDPSFVIGLGQLVDDGERVYRDNRYFDYVYEHGEVLSFLRFVVRQIHPYETCNPRIRTVRFNTLSGWIVNQHRMASLADSLIDLSRPELKSNLKTEQRPLPRHKTNFKLRAGCKQGA